MEFQEAAEIVRTWEETVNTAEIERLLDLSHPEIELVGPRGSAFGRDMLRDWLARAGLSLETQRCFARGETVVNEQLGVWRALTTGDVMTGDIVSQAKLASHYRVKNGQVSYVARYDTLQEAFEQSGLSKADEVQLRFVSGASVRS